MSKCYICGQSGEMRELDSLEFVLCDEHYQDFQLFFLYNMGKVEQERVWAEIKKDIMLDKVKSAEEIDDIIIGQVKEAVEDCYDFYFGIQDKIVHWLGDQRKKYEGNLSTKIGFAPQTKCKHDPYPD